MKETILFFLIGRAVYFRTNPFITDLISEYVRMEEEYENEDYSDYTE